jgi:hypothetical protein
VSTPRYIEDDHVADLARRDSAERKPCTVTDVVRRTAGTN